MPLSRDGFGVRGPSHPPPDFQWYHVVLTTYGAWLPGDPRGFRTRHHREHVEGDYKRPPPVGKFAEKAAHSAALLNRPAVTLASSWRPVLGPAVVERLRKLGAFLLCTAVSARHVHVLSKMPTDRADEWLAAVKRHAWFEMRDAGWPSKLWARGKRLTRVRTRSHQRNAFDYIVRHIHQGAWVWVWEGVDPRVIDDALSR